MNANGDAQIAKYGNSAGRTSPVRRPHRFARLRRKAINVQPGKALCKERHRRLRSFI